MKEPGKMHRDSIGTAPGDLIAMIYTEMSDLSVMVANLQGDVAILKDALRTAIVDRARVSKRTVEVDPAGNVYEYDWLPRVREWAHLCDLDLDKVDPYSYGDFYS